MNKVYANVRPESKYYEQQVQGKPFPVRLEPDIGGYHWVGGIGGQYRTADLHFFVEIENSGEVEFRKIALTNPAELNELELMKASVLQGCGKGWGSGYWERVINLLESLLRKVRKEYKAQLAREEREREEEREMWEREDEREMWE